MTSTQLGSCERQFPEITAFPQIFTATETSLDWRLGILCGVIKGTFESAILCTPVRKIRLLKSYRCSCVSFDESYLLEDVKAESTPHISHTSCRPQILFVKSSYRSGRRKENFACRQTPLPLHIILELGVKYYLDV